MVPIRENWSDADARVISVEPADHGFVRMEVALRSADDVAGFPNLLRDRVGQNLTVEMPAKTAQAAGLSSGADFSARLRLGTPDLAFAHPALVNRATE